MKKSILFFCVASLLGVTGIANADPFQNGSFEDPGASPGALSLFAGNATITPWTITAGSTVGSVSIDYVGPVPLTNPPTPPPTSGWTAAQGTSSIGMNGNGLFLSGTGILSQTFDTVAGTSYEVIFAMAGNPYGNSVSGVDPIKDLRVSAADFLEGSPPVELTFKDFTFDTNGKTPTNMGWVDQPFTFTAAGIFTTLTFASLENSFYGAAIDNVRVSAVPEPASLLLLSAGLTGLAFFGRKKFVN